MKLSQFSKSVWVLRWSSPVRLVSRSHSGVTGLTKPTWPSPYRCTDREDGRFGSTCRKFNFSVSRDWLSPDRVTSTVYWPLSLSSANKLTVWLPLTHSYSLFNITAIRNIFPQEPLQSWYKLKLAVSLSDSFFIFLTSQNCFHCKTLILQLSFVLSLCDLRGTVSCPASLIHKIVSVPLNRDQRIFDIAKSGLTHMLLLEEDHALIIRTILFIKKNMKCT